MTTPLEDQLYQALSAMVASCSKHHCGLLIADEALAAYKAAPEPPHDEAIPAWSSAYQLLGPKQSPQEEDIPTWAWRAALNELALNPADQIEHFARELAEKEKQPWQPQTGSSYRLSRRRRC